jgi:hypothetical protein
MQPERKSSFDALSDTESNDSSPSHGACDVLASDYGLLPKDFEPGRASEPAFHEFAGFAAFTLSNKTKKGQFTEYSLTSRSAKQVKNWKYRAHNTLKIPCLVAGFTDALGRSYGENAIGGFPYFIDGEAGHLQDKLNVAIWEVSAARTITVGAVIEAAPGCPAGRREFPDARRDGLMQLIAR